MRINKLSIILLGGLLAMPPVSYSDTSESVGLAAGIMANALFSDCLLYTSPSPRD